MLEINRNPSRRELAWFGLALGCFFAILGGMIAWRTGAVLVPRVLWATGAVVVALYYAVPPLRRPIFVAWTTLTFPIGWLLTHLVLALIYYLVLTPAGLVMRLAGHDPMRRRFDRGAASYWDERPPQRESASYFRQF